MFSKLIVIAAAVLAFGVGTASATPLGQQADGLRLQGLADRYAYLQGVKADGLRWVAMRRFYAAKPETAVAAGEGFNWGDAGVGAGAALAAATLCGAALIFVRHSRRTKLAH